LGCYEGILRYAATRPDWHVVVDPFLIGVTYQSGVNEYDGIVGRINAKGAEQAKAAGIPVVNRWINSPARNLPRVLPDTRQGCRMAAEHLLARGFRRFGYVGSTRDQSCKLHLAGFEPSIVERGLTVEKFDPPLRCETNSKVFAQFYNHLKEWMAGLTTPIALLVHQEVTALYIMQMCHELNLRIPHDVGMVTCRENPTVCLQSTPTISSIEDDNERIGYCAAELLDQLMLGQIAAPTEPVWIEPKAMRARGSTDAFVSEDPIVSRAMRFIAEHAGQSITIDDVAQAVESSPRTLQLRFAQYVGRSVYSEINRLRIETVKRILIDSDVALETVASGNGFTDVSHLVKNFRKTTGTTPGEFRKQHRLRRGSQDVNKQLEV
jgi:LacI family transcriptional regulator